LTVVCDHATGKVIWAARGRSKAMVGEYFDALGKRAENLQFVIADGATWITEAAAERAPDAIVRLDTSRVIGWATASSERGRPTGPWPVTE
jgi:transposase